MVVFLGVKFFFKYFRLIKQISISILTLILKLLLVMMQKEGGIDSSQRKGKWLSAACLELDCNPLYHLLLHSSGWYTAIAYNIEF